MSRTLLREYIKQALLTEEVETGMGHDLTGGWGSVTTGQLWNVFASPFTDVIRTAAGEAKEIMRRSQTLLAVLLETLKTTLVPFLDNNYKEIFSNEQAAINQIRSQNRDVYDRTRKALQGDAQMIAFLAAPGTFLAATAGKMSAMALKETLSIATGGVSDRYLRESIFKGVILREQDDQKKTLLGLLQKDEIKNAISKQSAELKSIADQLVAVKDKTAESTKMVAEKILSSSLEDLKRQIGDDKIEELINTLMKEGGVQADKKEDIKKQVKQKIIESVAPFLEQATLNAKQDLVQIVKNMPASAELFKDAMKSYDDAIRFIKTKAR